MIRTGILLCFPQGRTGGSECPYPCLPTLVSCSILLAAGMNLALCLCALPSTLAAGAGLCAAELLSEMQHSGWHQWARTWSHQRTSRQCRHSPSTHRKRACFMKCEIDVPLFNISENTRLSIQAFPTWRGTIGDDRVRCLLWGHSSWQCYAPSYLVCNHCAFKNMLVTIHSFWFVKSNESLFFEIDLISHCSFLLRVFKLYMPSNLNVFPLLG